MSSVAPSIDEDWADEGGDKQTRKSVKGRKLMRWNPDVDQFVLLCVDHVCVKQGIQIPWDLVANEVEPYLTGEAIKQHLAKLRTHRAEVGRKVPEKLDSSVRRRATKLANSVHMTPAKGGRGRRAKGEGHDEEDDAPLMKGTSLLWTAPAKKATRAPRKEGAGAGATPKTPGTGRGRKKANVEGEGDLGVDGDFGVPSVPNPKSTGKRGRKPKETKKKDASDGSDHESPMKKQKTIGLRATHRVDYNEQPDQDEDIFDAEQGEPDDGAYEEEVDFRAQTAVKVEPGLGSSQGSSPYNLPPPPAFPLPSAPALHQVYQPDMTSSTWDHANNHHAMPHGQQVIGSVNGLPGHQSAAYMDHSNHYNFSGGLTNPFGPFYSGSGLASDPLGSSMTEDHIGYINYEPGIAGFHSDVGQQLHEQGFYDATGAIPGLLSDEIVANSPALQAQGREQMPKANAMKTSSDEGMATSGGRGAQQFESGLAINKLENDVRRADDGAFNYNIQTSGNVPITNAIGGGNGISNLASFDFAHHGGHTDLHVKTTASPLQQMLATTSPDDYNDNAYGLVGGNGNRGATLSANNLLFEDQYPQLNEVASHTIAGSQSVEAIPRIMPSQSSFDLQQGPLDALAYDQPIPGNEHADEEFLGMGFY